MKIWVDGHTPPPNGFKWTRTSWEAIEMLRKGRCIYISLDYHLGNVQDCGDGYMVACWIETQTVNRKLKERIDWHCHCKSVVGKKIIESALRNADAVWNKLI